MPTETEETEQTEQTEDQIERNESDLTSDDRKSAFDLGEGDDVTGLTQDLEEFGGDEGLDRDQDLQDVDPDTPIDDLARGATASSEEESSPPQEEPEEGDSEPEQSEPESEQDQTEDLPADIDRETLEFVQENREKVQNLQEWETKLTQRSQAISDVETLAEIRQVAAQDPGRAEAFREFIDDMADGKYDADREVEVETPEIPEAVEGTEHQEFFEQLVNQNKELAEQLNRQRKLLSRQNQQQQAQQQSPDELVGQDQGASAMGDEQYEEIVQEEVERYENFIDSHPDLVDENGNPTPELEQIQQLMNRTGGGLESWEQAYYAVKGEDVRGSAEQSETQEEQQTEQQSRTATPTSELVDDSSSSGSDDGKQNRYNELQNAIGSRGELAKTLDDLS